MVEEHAKQNPTFVDASISKILHECTISHPDNEDGNEQEESELNDALRSHINNLIKNAKKAGSQLKNRIVAERPVAEWSKLIEQMEDQVSAVLQEEREERALRKAEMEATKAENMIMHKDEIYARPKRTWFATEKEKKALAKAVKASLDKDKNGQVLSAQEAEELKLKEKRKREREKNLPRKKRRRLEAAREMLENEEDNNEDQEVEGRKMKKAGQSLVDLAYKRAKSIKAMKKMHDSGKKLKNTAKNQNPVRKDQSRKEEMVELFQNDMSDRKQARISKKSNKVSARMKSKSSFKSKSRYKRRK